MEHPPETVTVTDHAAMVLAECAAETGVDTSKIAARALSLYGVLIDALDAGHMVILRPRFDDYDLPQLIRVAVYESEGAEHPLRSGVFPWPLDVL